ncbi:hypothetical protein N665_1151s0002 [Sinapis alba]|nr:hypothetical protein N665_1151s0002 [Sinapis alba]
MAKKHFFQPLLPGFHSHLTIPVAFFSKHIQGRNDEKTTAKLSSDASEKTWEVKTEDSRRLTDGWKEFALAHNLRVGDILIFRQEKGKINLEKKNPKREAEYCSSDPSCFLASVMPSTLRYDLLNLPMSFVRANGLETRCGDIVLMNEKGRSWTLSLKQRQCGRRSYITRGWRCFCRANGLKTGDFVTFKLIKRGGTLILLRKSPSHREEDDEDSKAGDEIEPLSTKPDIDEEGNKDEKSLKRRISIWKASSSPSLNRFVTLTLKPYNLTNFFPNPSQIYMASLWELK